VKELRDEPASRTAHGRADREACFAGLLAGCILALGARAAQDTTLHDKLSGAELLDP
jgi:hypothetical protein